ncbi:hypothetical protein WUBG_12064 [Wuchereria bancrofti]|uniref:ShKT domain-containing protein n=1 Tax=Wuchereria bancrofti TaxID=6293 RepID=J9EJ57_WUCBA|nr:hypothetical protein WUBG_12064 [Wuchereria bancrofti]
MGFTRTVFTEFHLGSVQLQTCNDYHRSCPDWAARGECSINAWMLENCRRSCRSCLDQWQLRQRCRINSDLSSSHTPNFVPTVIDDFYYDIL